jgi:hypothetical protein
VTKPKYLQAAEHFAAQKGISVPELFEQLHEAASRYPGPECLEPHEVAHQAEGNALPADRQAHVDACGDCYALVLSTRGSAR